MNEERTVLRQEEVWSRRQTLTLNLSFRHLVPFPFFFLLRFFSFSLYSQFLYIIMNSQGFQVVIDG